VVGLFKRQKSSEKRGMRPSRILLIIVIVIEVSAFLTAIGFFIAAIISGFEGYEFTSTGDLYSLAF